MSAEAPSGRPKRRSVSTLAWLITICLVAIIGLVISLGADKDEPQEKKAERKLPNVEISTIKAVSYEQTLTLPARLKARNSAAVSTEFQSRLAVWRVGEGEPVRRGDVVAELDSVLVRAELEELRAKLETTELASRMSVLAARRAEVELEKVKRDAEALKLEKKRAESRLELATSEHERAELLVSEKVLGKAELDATRDMLTQAKVGVEQAEDAIGRSDLGIEAAGIRATEAKLAEELGMAQLAEISAAIRSLEARLEKHTLRAPIDGVLEEHLVEPGEFVGGGEPVAHLYDSAKLFAVVNVSDRFVPFLRADLAQPLPKGYGGDGGVPTLSAKLALAGLPKLTGGKAKGIVLPARLVWIAQASDPATNTFEVELEVDNPGNALREGVIGTAEIGYLTFERAIVIPVRALQVSDAGPRVLVLEERGERKVVRARSIEPLSIKGEEVLVGSGLVEGDMLVVAGWKGLISGEEVNVVVEDGAVVANP